MVENSGGATRRRFLQLAAALGVAPWLGPGCRPATPTREPEREPPVPPVPPRPEGLRAPDDTGLLDAEDIDELWAMFRYIDAAWESSCSIDTRAGFKRIVDLKTGRAPSYASEYRAAAAQLRAARARVGDSRALHRTFFAQHDGYIHHHVVAELLRLHVAFGGFRAFGYRNYKGAMGGPFADAARPPYRVWRES